MSQLLPQCVKHISLHLHQTRMWTIFCVNKAKPTREK
jgi:hypothetical protein